MRFEAFHHLYRTIRLRLGREDDLLDDAVAESAAMTETGGMIEGSDGADYHVVALKRVHEGKRLAHVSVQRHDGEGSALLVSAGLDLGTREVGITWPREGMAGVEALVEALVVGSDRAIPKEGKPRRVVREIAWFLASEPGQPETYHGDTACGTYASWEDGGKGYWLHERAFSRIVAGTSLADAQAAAQAHLDARILSALEPWVLALGDGAGAVGERVPAEAAGP